MARPGERCTPVDLQVLTQLRGRVEHAREIVLQHAAGDRELKRVEEELRKRMPPSDAATIGD